MKPPFPYKLKPTAANKARVKKLLDPPKGWGTRVTLSSTLLAALCRKPLLRAVFVWREHFERNGLSPFALSALAGVGVDQTLEQLAKEHWVYSIKYCSGTNLPVCWYLGQGDICFFDAVPKAKDLVESYEGRIKFASSYAPAPSFAEVRARFEGWERHPRFFAWKGSPGMIHAGTWAKLLKAVRMEEEAGATSAP